MSTRESEPKVLRVLLIDFSPVVRAGLQAILAKDETIEVVGLAPDCDEALSQIKRANRLGRPVNVVLTETRNGNLDGVQVTRLIKDEFPEVVCPRADREHE